MVKVSSLMSMTRKKPTATEPTQETTVAAEVVTKMANAEKAVDAEVAVEEATARDAEEATARDAEEVTEIDAEEATVAPREEALQMVDPTESEPTLLMKTETQLLTVLRPVDTERDTRASQEKVTTHSTESPELAAEEETTVEMEPAMDGVKIRRRSQKPLKVKRPRESQLAKTTETREETTVTETRKDVPRETPQLRRKSPRRKLDSPSMTTKPRRRLVTSRLPPEDSTRRLTRRVSSPTMSRRSALR